MKDVNVPVIAIVDDDASVRRSLHRLVQAAGYPAETFASAREFLEWLPRGRAACLVLDVHMNELSGFDLQERLAVPIIFITAHDDAPTRERIQKSGASAHLRKPFDEQAVLDAIRSAVAANGGPKEPHAVIGVDQGGRAAAD
ncbi:MAG TPA: response regulator [Methylomirabilota bacterium]|nr:response regulator [Methylomirabilota bacterium]